MQIENAKNFSFELIYADKKGISVKYQRQTDTFVVRSSKHLGEKFIRQFLAQNLDKLQSMRERALASAVTAIDENTVLRLLGKPHTIRFTKRLSVYCDGFHLARNDEETMRKDIHKIYRTLAAKYLIPRVTAMAAQFELAVSSIKINSANGRFGSCTRAGNLNFSWRLMQYPAEIIDYVIIHELAHLIELNHSPAFWRQVARMCPPYRKIKNDFRRMQIEIASL